MMVYFSGAAPKIELTHFVQLRDFSVLIIFDSFSQVAAAVLCCTEAKVCVTINLSCSSRHQHHQQRYLKGAGTKTKSYVQYINFYSIKKSNKIIKKIGNYIKLCLYIMTLNCGVFFFNSN